jgi:GntR family transcriptional regulator
MMLFRPNPASGVPIYLQLIEQIKHAIESGVLRPGEQLPGIRKIADELVMNPNTVAKAYRELEHEGVIELRQGSGAFVAGNGQGRARLDRIQNARPVMRATLEQLMRTDLTEDELRRLFEGELTRLREQAARGNS